MRRSFIPHDALVFVGDGRKALFLRNAGDELFAHFVVEQSFVDDNPPTREQGADRPGRSVAGVETARRGAMEPTDWHDIEEHRFAERVAKALGQLTRARKTPALAIAAPPRALADVRATLDEDVKAKIVVEINKDLTRMPVWDIERHFLDALAIA